jgi:hypothetical protein
VVALCDGRHRFGPNLFVEFVARYTHDEHSTATAAGLRRIGGSRDAAVELTGGRMIWFSIATMGRSVWIAWIGSILLACASSDTGMPMPSGSAGASSASTGSGSTTTGSTGSGSGGAAGEGGTTPPDGSPGLPPIDPQTPLDSLTNAQRAMLCDWMIVALGGYGAMIDCGISTRQNYADQASCVASAFMYRCPVTVGQYETCIIAQEPDHACSFPFDQCHPLVCQ